MKASFLRAYVKVQGITHPLAPEMLWCPPPPPPAWIIAMRAASLRPDIPYLWLDRCPERVEYWHSSETSGVGWIDVETPHFLHDHAARQPRSCFFHIGIFLHHMKHSMNCQYTCLRVELRYNYHRTTPYQHLLQQQTSKEGRAMVHEEWGNGWGNGR